MTVSEILNELEPYTGRFPMEAMRAAIEQREAITPELQRLVQAVAENPEQYARREGYMLHLFALYLLVLRQAINAGRPVGQKPSSSRSPTGNT